MTVPRWDAQRWQDEQKTPARKPRLKMVASMAAVALFLGAAVVSATVFDEKEQIGICHATGSAETPYVFLIVDKNGYEHGHHRHHEADFFVDPSVGGCEGDRYEAAQDAGNETQDNATEAPAGNTTEAHDATEGAGNSTEADDTAEDTGNSTATGNTEDAANTTVNATADAWVRQQATQEQDLVVIVLEVGNAGTGDALAVELTDSLPDVKRTWYLGGADASACVLDDRELSCWFGQLAPGETRQVELQSYTDRMPCGYSLTNTAQVDSEDDVQPRNNASSASILARAC